MMMSNDLLASDDDTDNKQQLLLQGVVAFKPLTKHVLCHLLKPVGDVVIGLVVGLGEEPTLRVFVKGSGGPRSMRLPRCHGDLSGGCTRFSEL